MRIYFILTALLVISALTLPLAVNVISSKLTSIEATAAVQQSTEAAVTEADGVNETVKVHRASTGAVVEVDMYEYIIGTVAGEMPASFCSEALKAQAVACYTYAKYIKENSDKKDSFLSDSSLTHQSYIDQSEQKKKWGEYYDEYRGQIEKAVKSVYGEYITFDGKTAMTVFHALSADKTNSAEEIWGEAVPYLVSVNSPSDTVTKADFKFNAEEFKSLLEEKTEVKLNNEPNKWAKVLERDEDGYIRRLSVDNKAFTAVEIMDLLSLPSANFTAKYNNNTFIFTATGKGHGVGMSQYAAEYMASEGKSYTEILSHFYPGTTLVKE